MIKRTLADLKPYDAANHFKMTAMRIHGKEETGAENFWVGISIFPPNEGRHLINESNKAASMLVIINYPK